MTETEVTKVADLQQWPHLLITYTLWEVQTYCVDSADWQRFRMAMKGIPTPRKLSMLEGWLLADGEAPSREVEVQVSNYINALKRGGQLDMKLRVLQ